MIRLSCATIRFLYMVYIGVRKNKVASEDIFGRWLVLGPEDETLHMSKTKWICQCQCGSGQLKMVRYEALVRGDSKSCGCLKSELAAVQIRRNKSGIQHGEATGKRTVEYKTWTGIKQRCLNPKNDAYHRYGGRGITVYAPWINDYPSFLAYVGRRPAGKTSLGRKNNDGNYEPGNVRWENDTEQANNKSTNHFLEIEGESKTISEWSLVYDISDKNIRNRLSQGWDADEAVKIPTLKHGIHLHPSMYEPRVKTPEEIQANKDKHKAATRQYKIRKVIESIVRGDGCWALSTGEKVTHSTLRKLWRMTKPEELPLNKYVIQICENKQCVNYENHFKIGTKTERLKYMGWPSSSDGR